MTTVISDLVARVRAEGVQETRAQVQAVGEEAKRTADALEIMAGQFAKLHGGTAADALTMFQRTGVQPTAAAMAQAAAAAEKTTAAITASVVPTQTAAKAADDMQKGWSASESSLVRFGAALVGVNLGISLIAGAARMVHGAIGDIVTGQLDWERSLKNLSGLYGEVGGRAAALATAQSNLPGVLGDQREFAQAAINASAMTLRYGLPQQLVNQLTTTGGRVAFAAGMTNEADRAQLQSQILAAVQTGAPLPARYGVYTDAEAVSRTLGFSGAQSLQAFTPQEVMQARGAIVSQNLNAFADRAAANRRAALDAATNAEKALEQARSNIQNNLESGAAYGAFGSGPIVDPMSGRIVGGPAGSGPLPVGDVVRGGGASAAAQRSQEAAALQTYLDNQEQVAQAAVVEAQALANSAKAQDEARKTLEALARSADAAGAQLLHFFGSLEDATSIGHGDILAQAQGAVAARAVGPNPLAFQTQGDLQAQARNRAAQDAWQTYVAARGQDEQTDAIRRNLGQLAAQQGPGLEPQRAAAQQALAEETRRAPAALALRNAEQADALAQLRVAEQQSNVEEISLRYRERALNVERETIGLRKTETQITLDNVTLTERVLKAQQAAMPSGIALQSLSYEQQRTILLAQERQAGLIRGMDVSGLPSFDELISRNVSLRLQEPSVARRALEANQAVVVAGQAATAGGLAAGLAQAPITRASLQLALAQYGDDPARLSAELGLTEAQGRALTTGRGVRAATAALANVNLTVNVGGTVRLADDAIKAAAQAAYDQVEQALREGLQESDQAAPPASSQLAGARR